MIVRGRYTAAYELKAGRYAPLVRYLGLRTIKIFTKTDRTELSPFSETATMYQQRRPDQDEPYEPALLGLTAERVRLDGLCGMSHW